MWKLDARGLVCCLALFLAGGCAGNGQGTTEATIADTSWTLVRYGLLDAGEPVQAGTEITFHLEDGEKVTGSSGCNNYGATCTVKGHSLRIGLLTSTKRACTEPPKLMEMERQFLSALQETTRYTITDNELTLYGRDSRGLVFRRVER